jgi:hypothetical protein
MSQVPMMVLSIGTSKAATRNFVLEGREERVKGGVMAGDEG